MSRSCNGFVRVVLLAALVLLGGCAGGLESTREIGTEPESAAGKPGQDKSDEVLEGRQTGGGGEEVSQETAETPEGLATSRSQAQRMLDRALELCEQARQSWAKGELDEAEGLLDEAYGLLIRADFSSDDEMERQRRDIRLAIARRLLEVQAARQSTAVGARRVIPLDINDEVRQEIERFKGPERRFFLASYRRSGRYRPMILRKLEQAGLPAELSWLPLIESGFKVRALSVARALGLWQFIPSTGYRFGLRRDRWVDERMDPEKSTDAAIRYLQELHRIFGDWTTALAAYNCGENLVLRLIKRQEVNYLDNFWDLYQRLPEQTRRYVPKFIAVLNIVKQPEKFGFELPEPEKPPEVEEIEINKRLHLKDVARVLGVGQDVLARLNPELRRMVVPPGGYTLKVPRGKARFASALDSLPEYKPPQPKYVVHRIRQGDTLSGLARRYRVRVAEICRVNRIRPDSILRIGQRLRIPNRRGARKARRHGSGAKVVKKARRFVEVVVKPGDSMWGLARRYGSDVDTIRRLNGLRDYSLRVGQRLRIPSSGRKEEVAERHGPSKPGSSRSVGTYSVRPGDTLFSIARRHGMKLQRLLEINGLEKDSAIKPGQVIKVERKD